MSYTTIQQCVRDPAFQDRVTSGAMKEAIVSPVYSKTEFGKQLAANPILAINTFLWPVSIEYETEYEYALNSSNPNPGGDPTVITDPNIQSSIQAHWPDDPANLPSDLIPDPTTQ